MPLVYRDKGTSGTQLEVLSNTFQVGHIRKEKFSISSGAVSIGTGTWPLTGAQAGSLAMGVRGAWPRPRRPSSATGKSFSARQG